MRRTEEVYKEESGWAKHLEELIRKRDKETFRTMMNEAMIGAYEMIEKRSKTLVKKYPIRLIDEI